MRSTDEQLSHHLRRAGGLPFGVIIDALALLLTQGKLERQSAIVGAAIDENGTIMLRLEIVPVGEPRGNARRPRCALDGGDYTGKLRQTCLKKRQGQPQARHSLAARGVSGKLRCDFNDAYRRRDARRDLA